VASEATGQAALVDAERDVDRYFDAAKGLGLSLRYALDTHLHNDFVSGVRELALLPGLQVGASASAGLSFDHLPLNEGVTLSLGELTLGILATPGHTPEHISFTLTLPNQAEPTAVFTGGALMVGGAARTDLLGPEWTSELARKLHHSLHGKLLTLPDNVRVYPTHGAGSFCAAPVSSDRTTTIGRERATNYLARTTGVEEFVALATSDLPTYPTYFHEMRALNQRGPAVLGGLPRLRPMTPDDILGQQANGAVIVDLRPTYEFVAGHIPGSFSVAMREAFGTWIGWVVPFGTTIMLVSHETPSEHEAAVRQLIRIGYDHIAGVLKGGIDNWQAEGRPVARWSTITPAELHDHLARRDGLTVVDVRQKHEWQAGHVVGAIHAEAGTLAGQPLDFRPDHPLAVHCGHHDRSATALSLLERRGFKNLHLIEGGFGALEQAGLPTESGHD